MEQYEKYRKACTTIENELHHLYILMQLILNKNHE